MTDIDSDELVLDQLRNWLREARGKAAEVDESANGSPQASPIFGLLRLVEEFTALRHELKLQTRGSRALEERVEASLGVLAEATSASQAAALQFGSASALTAEKNLALAFAELDEALNRFFKQLEKIADRIIHPSPPSFLHKLRESWSRQSWWRRTLTAAYHLRVAHEIQEFEEQARRERQELLSALLSGYRMIQQRLARAMANAGVARILVVGRPVDPEQMIVLEVVPAEGNPGEVIEEVRHGYTWKGGVLRPAEVRASRPRFDHPSGLLPEDAMSELEKAN